MFSLSIVRNAISRINAHRSLYVSAALRNNLQTTEQIVLETRDITKDRTEPVPLEKSLRYLKSEAYRQTYGGQPVWVQYRYLRVRFFVHFHPHLFAGEITKGSYHRRKQEKPASDLARYQQEILVLFAGTNTWFWMIAT